MSDLVVETGVGLLNSNSYATVDEADVYHEDHLFASAWTTATEETKEKALIWSTRLLNEQVRWYGYKKTSTQALAWPRNSVVDYDGYSVNSDSIPIFLKRATAEFARHLIVADRTAETEITGFKKIKVGEIELDIDRFSKAPLIPKSVWSIIYPYGYRAGSVISTVRM